MKYIEERIKDPRSWAGVAAGAAAVAVFLGQPWILAVALAAGVIGILLKERKE